MFTVIINPFAGKNRKTQYHLEVLQSLHQASITFTPIYTSERMEAGRIVQNQYHQGVRNFIVVGGDGTFNEVVHGLYNLHHLPEKVKFVFIPAGTGNDWARTMYASGFDLDHIGKIKSDKYYVQQDIGEVRFKIDNKLQKTYFINMLGLGFDVYVSQNYMGENKKLGIISYLFALFRGLFSYKKVLIEVIFDDRILKSEFFLAAVGVGEYLAGGMKILPGAKPIYGVLHMTLIKSLSILQRIKMLPFIFSSKLKEFKSVENFKCKRVRIEGRPGTYFHVDGEIRGQLPVEVVVMPRELNVFIGNNNIYTGGLNNT